MTMSSVVETLAISTNQGLTAATEESFPSKPRATVLVFGDSGGGAVPPPESLRQTLRVHAKSSCTNPTHELQGGAAPGRARRDMGVVGRRALALLESRGALSPAELDEALGFTHGSGYGRLLRQDLLERGLVRVRGGQRSCMVMLRRVAEEATGEEEATEEATRPPRVASSRVASSGVPNVEVQKKRTSTRTSVVSRVASSPVASSRVASSRVGSSPSELPGDFPALRELHRELAHILRAHRAAEARGASTPAPAAPGPTQAATPAPAAPAKQAPPTAAAAPVTKSARVRWDASTSPEAAAVAKAIAEIRTVSNRDFPPTEHGPWGPSSERNVRRYDFELVRQAVHHVQAARAKADFPWKKNPMALLMRALERPHDFPWESGSWLSCADFAEEQAEKARQAKASARVAPSPRLADEPEERGSTAVQDHAAYFSQADSHQRRQIELQTFYEGLAPERQRDVDARAEKLVGGAKAEGPISPLQAQLRDLRILSRRNELLEEEFARATGGPLPFPALLPDEEDDQEDGDDQREAFARITAELSAEMRSA